MRLRPAPGLTKGRSGILDYGTATRTIPANLWNALVIRDEHCRFPGCDRRSAWCEGHHVRWVTHGGATDIDNLVLLCSRHHHRLHQPDWQAKLLPDATFEVTDPNGMVRATSPHEPSRRGEGAARLDGVRPRPGLPRCASDPRQYGAAAMGAAPSMAPAAALGGADEIRRGLPAGALGQRGAEMRRAAAVWSAMARAARTRSWGMP
ncbi:MAG: hypothetical protein QOG43_2129 [Actinomycetota bacterium]|nr:hypothetical protein [Actinomycetota bacterium]